MDLVLAVTPPKLAAQYRNLQRAFKEVLDVRNRLANFKDNDTPVTGRLACIDDVHTVFESSDDSELIYKLKAPLVVA